MNGLRLIRVLLPMVQAIILLAASVETCDSARLKSEYFEYHPFGVASVVTENDRAYVSATDGVRIYDIKRPKRPQLLGFYKSEAANDIKVEGNYAFVCGGLINKEKGYLKILDISSPARIKLAGEALLSHGSVGVEIAKNHAYVSGLGEGLFIIDVSNKNSPKLVRKANFPRVENPMAVAKIVSRLKKGPKKFPLKLGRTWWTHIEGNFLYANDENTGLHVLEISNPKNPIEIGSLIHEFMPKSTQLAVEAFNDIDVENNIGFITLDNGGMVIVDLQNKNHPIILYHYNPWKGYNWKTSPGHMIKIEVMGNTAYLTAGEEGLYVMDIKNPRKPNLIEKHAVHQNVGQSWGVFARNGLVFVTYIAVDPGDKKKNKRKGLKGGWEIFRVVGHRPQTGF